MKLTIKKRYWYNGNSIVVRYSVFCNKFHVRELTQEQYEEFLEKVKGGAAHEN